MLFVLRAVIFSADRFVLSTLQIWELSVRRELVSAGALPNQPLFPSFSVRVTSLTGGLILELLYDLDSPFGRPVS